MKQIAEAFSDPQVVAHYTDGPPRMVPGYVSMQHMTTLLLTEQVPDDGHVLVLGAGGGLEIKVIAEAHTTWSFLGVDPSAAMLHLAEQVLGPLAARVTLKEGTIDDALAGPFDGATCLLTMHFLSLEERPRTAVEVRRRLKPRSPFVVAHFSLPNSEAERALWLSRYTNFAISSGIEPEKAWTARRDIGEKLTILTPEQDEKVLGDAGFSNVSLFYAGFTFRGWVGYASSHLAYGQRGMTLYYCSKKTGPDTMSGPAISAACLSRLVGHGDLLDFDAIVVAADFDPRWRFAAWGR